MGQLVLRLLVLLANVVANSILLASFQAFALSPNYAWTIVAFNAILIFLIFAVDFVIVKWRRLRAEIKIGTRVMDGHLNEV